MDCYLHHQCSWRRTILRLHLFRLFRWPYRGSCWTALGEQGHWRTESSFSLWYPDFGVWEKCLVLPSGADATRLSRLEITIWKVPSLVGNAVTVAFVGVFVSHLGLTPCRGVVGNLVVILAGSDLPHRCQPRVQDPSSLAPHRYVTCDTVSKNEWSYYLVFPRNQVRLDGSRVLDKRVPRCCR